MLTEVSSTIDLTKRPRRNRKSAAIRSLVEETFLHPRQLVAPLFLVEGTQQRQAISSMPGIFRFSADCLMKEIEELHRLGVRTIDLFPVIPHEKKDSCASEAIRADNLLYKTIRKIKQAFPEVCVMVDVALDPYTDHGHDGLVDENYRVVNDTTLEVLGQIAVIAADAGVDFVAPSDMMDGRVGYIRKQLDPAGHTDVGILSYVVKYASAFYGPFWQALDSAPRFGDKKTYQLNPANRREAILEALLDESEGADLLLVKPALPYLDVIHELRQHTQLPIGGYHVSGEYAMVHAAAEKGWIDGGRAMHESLLSIKRAGADFIFTYAARYFAECFRRDYS